jgi:hypothetical protein
MRFSVKRKYKFPLKIIYPIWHPWLWWLQYCRRGTVAQFQDFTNILLHSVIMSHYHCAWYEPCDVTVTLYTIIQNVIKCDFHISEMPKSSTTFPPTLSWILLPTSSSLSLSLSLSLPPVGGFGPSRTNKQATSSSSLPSFSSSLPSSIQGIRTKKISWIAKQRDWRRDPW